MVGALKPNMLLKEIFKYFTLSGSRDTKTSVSSPCSWAWDFALIVVSCDHTSQWRIQDFPRGGANSQKCYYFSIFCRKLHENEQIWIPRGGAHPWLPPLDLPMQAEYAVKIVKGLLTHAKCSGQDPYQDPS